MMIAILLLSIVAVSAQNDPQVVEYNGYEISFYTNEASGQLTYDNAKQVCVDAGARLAEIKSADVQDFITTQLTDLGLVEGFSHWLQGYWVGGVCGGGINNWKWEDGTSIGGSNYKNWFAGGGCPFSEPNSNLASSRAYVYPFKEASYGDQTCTGLLGTWGDDDKSTMMNWICMKLYKVAMFNGYEFSFYTNEKSGKLTYDDAKQVCVDAGARLAEIKSADVQDFITAQLTDLGLVEIFSNWYQGYWVGGVSGGGGNPDGIYNWKWEDGTSIGSSNYDNWYYGGGCPFSEPNDNGGSDRSFILPFEEGRLGSQTCNGALGKWGDDDKNSKKNYICMKVFLLEIELNGLWYKFYNPSDPNDRLSYDGAKAKCESENGHLAYIKDDATQQMITTQLAGLNLVEDGWKGWDRGYWVGAKCVDCMGGNAFKNNWKWEDGTSIGNYNYENWYNEYPSCGQDPNSNAATSRGIFYSFDEYGICSGALGKWGDTVDGNDAKNWICMEDLCDSNPCENGGTCNHVSGGSQCNCADGFIGDYCQTDLCDSNPCENGGTCNHAPAGYQCNCADGFIGDYCQTDLCDSNICGYCATCNHTSGGYQCNCADGFIGDNYETGIPLISVDGVPTFNLVITRNQTQSLNLTCEFNQQFDVSTSFIWMKNEDIKSESNSLTIDNLGSADLGLYSCITKDTFGSFSTTRYLDVHYPPEQFKVTNAVNNVCEWDLDGAHSCNISFNLNPPTHNASLTKDGLLVSNDYEYLP